MTEDEFQVKMIRIIEEFNRAHNDKYNVFVYFAKEGGDVYQFGYGCPGCAAEDISNALARDIIKHNIKEVIN